jgi:hypothetical protein
VQPKIGPVLATRAVAEPSRPARAAASDVTTFATDPAWNTPYTPVLSRQGPYTPVNFLSLTGKSGSVRRRMNFSLPGSKSGHCARARTWPVSASRTTAAAALPCLAASLRIPDTWVCSLASMVMRVVRDGMSP